MLQHIHLENFRCFEHYDIDFTSGVNLLIGDNGSGKTSIIKAVILALNSFSKGSVTRILHASELALTISIILSTMERKA